MRKFRTLASLLVGILSSCSIQPILLEVLGNPVHLRCSVGLKGSRILLALHIPFLHPEWGLFALWLLISCSLEDGILINDFIRIGLLGLRRRAYLFRSIFKKFKLVPLWGSL